MSITTGRLEAPLVKQAGMLEAITEGAASLLKHKGLAASTLPVDSYALSAGLGTGASELVRRLGGRRFYGTPNKRRLGKALELLAAGSVGGASGVAGSLTAPVMTNIRYKTVPTAARDLAQWTGLGMGGEYLSKPFLEYATGKGSGTSQTLKNLAAGSAAGSVGLAIKDKKELARQVSKALRAGKTGKDIPSRTLIQSIKRQLGLKAGLPQGTLPGIAGLGLIAGGSPILGTSTLLTAPMFNKDISKYVGEVTEELLKKKKEKKTLDNLYKKSSLNTTALDAPVYVTMPYCLDAPTTEKVAFGFLGKMMVNRFGKGLGSQGSKVRNIAKSLQTTGSRQSAGDLARGLVNRERVLHPPPGLGTTPPPPLAYSPEFLTNTQQANLEIPGIEGFKEIFTGGTGKVRRAGDYLKAQTVGRYQRGAAQARQSYTPMYYNTDDAISAVSQKAQTRGGRQTLVDDLGSNIDQARSNAPGVSGAQNAQSARYTNNMTSTTSRQADSTAFNYMGNDATQAQARYNSLVASVPAAGTPEATELAELRKFVHGGRFQTPRYTRAQEMVIGRAGAEAGAQRTQQAVAESTGNLTRRGEGAGFRARNTSEQGEAFGLGTGGAGEAGMGAVAGSQLIPFVEPTTAALAGGAMATPYVLRGTRRLFDGNNLERLRGLLKGRVFRGENARHLETSVLPESTLSQLEHMQGSGAGAGAFRRGVDETVKKVSDSAGLTRTSSKLRGAVESALPSNNSLTDNSRQAIIRSYEQGVAEHGAGLTKDQFRVILSRNTGYSTTAGSSKIEGLKVIENNLFNSNSISTAAKDLEKSVVSYRREMDALVRDQLKNRTSKGSIKLRNNIEKAQAQIKGNERAEAALGRIHRTVDRLTLEAAEQGSVIGDKTLKVINDTLRVKNLQPNEVIELEKQLKSLLEGNTSTFNVPGKKSIIPFRRVDQRKVDLNLDQGANTSKLKNSLEPYINLQGTKKFNPKDVLSLEALTTPGVGTNPGVEAFTTSGGMNTLDDIKNLAETGGEAGSRLAKKLLLGKVTTAGQLTQQELVSLGVEIPAYTRVRSNPAGRAIEGYVNQVINSNSSIDKGVANLRKQLSRVTGKSQASIDKRKHIEKAIAHIETYGLKGTTSGRAKSPNDVISTYSKDINNALGQAKTMSKRKGTIDTKLIKIEMKDQRPPLTNDQLKSLAPEEIMAYNTARVEGVAESIITSNPSVANDPLRILDEMVELGAIKPYEQKEALAQLRKLTQPEIESAGGPSSVLSTILGGLGVAGAAGYTASRSGKGGKVTKARKQVAKTSPVVTASWGTSPLQAPVVYRKKLASALVPPIRVKKPKFPKPEKVQPGHSMFTSTAEGASEASNRMKSSSLLVAPTRY